MRTVSKHVTECFLIFDFPFLKFIYKWSKQHPAARVKIQIPNRKCANIASKRYQSDIYSDTNQDVLLQTSACPKDIE